MTSIRNLVLTTTVLAAGFIGINGVAYAATGHGFLLGKTNSANHTTTLKNTGAGPALKLKSKKTVAPLAVNSTKVVTHLNADLVDGLSASALQTRGIKYALPNTQVGKTIIYTLPKLPAGIYQATYSVSATMTTKGNMIGCDFEVNNVSNLLGYGGVMTSTPRSTVAESSTCAPTLQACAASAWRATSARTAPARCPPSAWRASTASPTSRHRSRTSNNPTDVPLPTTMVGSGGVSAHVQFDERWTDNTNRRGAAPHVDRQFLALGDLGVGRQQG